MHKASVIQESRYEMFFVAVFKGGRGGSLDFQVLCNVKIRIVMIKTLLIRR